MLISTGLSNLRAAIGSGESDALGPQDEIHVFQALSGG
jgi:hypothetical protein